MGGILRHYGANRGGVTEESGRQDPGDEVCISWYNYVSRGIFWGHALPVLDGGAGSHPGLANYSRPDEGRRAESAALCASGTKGFLGSQIQPRHYFGREGVTYGPLT